MTKLQLAEFLKAIKRRYSRFIIPTDEKLLDSWYRQFALFPLVAAEKALAKHYETVGKSPSLPELVALTREANRPPPPKELRENDEQLWKRRHALFNNRGIVEVETISNDRPVTRLVRFSACVELGEETRYNLTLPICKLRADFILDHISPEEFRQTFLPLIGRPAYREMEERVINEILARKTGPDQQDLLEGNSAPTTESDTDGNRRAS